MDDQQVFEYIYEVREQSNAALWAYRGLVARFDRIDKLAQIQRRLILAEEPEVDPSSLGQGTAGDSQAFWWADALLSAATRVVRLIWPGRPMNPALVAFTEERGKMVRRALAVGEQPTWGHAVRDAFEHFDERLDLDLATGAAVAVDRNITSQDFSGVWRVRRLIDPARRVVRYADHEFDVEGIRMALESLGATAASWVDVHGREVREA